VVGIVCLPWTYFVITFGLPLWASFIGAALFLPVGGEKLGFVKIVPTIILGVLCADRVILASKYIPGPGLVPFSIAVGIAAFLIVLLSKIEIFEFVPSAFAGFATTFAVMTAYPKIGMSKQSIDTILAMLIGIILSYLIQMINGAVSAKLVKTSD
jgi:hypothetical protein